MSGAEKPQGSKEGKAERASRVLRNFNAVGALALAGVAVLVPVGGAAIGVWAGVNAVQAGGFEALRRFSKKSREKKGG